MNCKSHDQNWKICILYIYWKYLLCLQSNASGSFLKTCINFVEQRLRFSQFEGSIIPSRVWFRWNPTAIKNLSKNVRHIKKNTCIFMSVSSTVAILQVLFTYFVRKSALIIPKEILNCQKTQNQKILSTTKNYNTIYTKFSFYKPHWRVPFSKVHNMRQLKFESKFFFGWYGQLLSLHFIMHLTIILL